MNRKFGRQGAPRDNGDPASKLMLRRHFLDEYHADARCAVFDACQATGVLWGVLRQEYPELRYWGVDVKRKQGRLAIDSTRVLKQGPLAFDVIDVDTYGSPWSHWFALLPNIARPTTVFLTVGRSGAMNDIGNEALERLGLASSFVKHLPSSLRWKLSDWADLKLLTVAHEYGLQLTEAVESTASGNARYIGVRLTPE